jgi:tetrahydromethanopterin S-methyltransferase subunit G
MSEQFAAGILFGAAIGLFVGAILIYVCFRRGEQ